MRKNKTNALKIALFVFLGITIVGLTASLFGGLKSKDSAHKHSFEVVSTVPGTCTESGRETLKCTNCSFKTTREIPGDHNYSDFEICKGCGYSEVHTKVTDTVVTNEEESDYYLGDFNRYEKSVFLVLFNQGKDNEEGYYVIYDGSESFRSQTFCFEMHLEITEGSILLVSGTSDYFAAYKDITLYVANPSDAYVSLPSSDNYYNSDGDLVSAFDYYVDGKIVDVLNSNTLVVRADKLEIVIKDDISACFSFSLRNLINESTDMNQLSQDTPNITFDVPQKCIYVLEYGEI